MLNRVSAIVCFGVSEPQVDMLIEAAVGTTFEPVRWVVFGVNMSLLGALGSQWGKTVDLVLAMLPGTGKDVQDAALTILENEGVLLSECVWVRGTDVPGAAPVGMLATFDARGSGVSDLVVALGSFVDGMGPMHRGSPGGQPCA